MFHHFHNDEHPKSQGSIDQKTFVSMIDFLNSKYTILDSDIFIIKSLNKTIKSNEICLSFDDALKCQYDIAFPILEKKGISAFFFVYSSAFKDKPDKLEIYRYFRTIKYRSIDKFYEEFFSLLQKDNESLFQHHYEIFLSKNYLKNFLFYSENDRFFRYIRDIYLTTKSYENYMHKLMNIHSFNIEKAKKKLWIGKKDLINLQKNGHSIGLHSDSHPTLMSKLSYQEQDREYKKNKEFLQNILNSKNINSMAHPCGNYNQNTIKVLDKLGISIGFRANMLKIKNRSLLEIPREDHANVYKKMIGAK